MKAWLLIILAIVSAFALKEYAIAKADPWYRWETGPCGTRIRKAGYMFGRWATREELSSKYSEVSGRVELIPTRPGETSKVVMLRDAASCEAWIKETGINYRK